MITIMGYPADGMVALIGIVVLCVIGIANTKPPKPPKSKVVWGKKR